MSYKPLNVLLRQTPPGIISSRIKNPAKVLGKDVIFKKKKRNDGDRSIDTLYFSTTQVGFTRMLVSSVLNRIHTRSEEHP